MAQRLMGLPRQPFKQSSSFPGAGENDPASQLFDQFCSANTFHGIMDTFQQLCDVIGLHPVDHQIFYKQLKTRLLSWKAQSLWTKLDKRAGNHEYKKGTACSKTRALVIGAGPCGLRVAIEIALLGGKAVIMEKREGFSRNNVLHLWPFLIHDLKALGAKKFFGKFCAGAIDHISIRALQCILLKVALLVGVEVHSGVTFEEFSEPPVDQTHDKIGWRAKVTPAEHPVSEFVFDVCVSADGKRNTMTEFKRKEFRGKLAIAITANFINCNTKAEASVEEISGVAYIFNQKFFKDLNRHAGIDLENIVYYKDETHYFVMTAKKQSLLCKGVLRQDYDDPEILLSKENVDQQALLEYARQAADMSTQHQLPNLEFAHNHYGQPDVAMFDFTSMFAAEHASRVVERQGYRLLIGLVGDTLLEPFWPTGSGCARGFLSAFDSAWMVRSWASGKMTPLEVIAERESVYQLLSQTTPENLNKNYLQYTIDPNTRYLNLNLQVYKPHQVASKYDGHDKEYLNEIVRQAVQQSNRYDSVRDSHNLLKWIQRQLEFYQGIVKVIDLAGSWRSGLALCALIHRFRPELVDVYALDPNQMEANNQLAFDVIEKEFGVAPFTTGQEISLCGVNDKTMMASYLSRVCSVLRKESAASGKVSDDKSEDAAKAHLITIAKIGNRIRQRKEEMERSELGGLKRIQDPLSFCDVPSKRVKDLDESNVTGLISYGQFENIDALADLSKYAYLEKELRMIGPGVRGQNKVSILAKDLASKLSGETSKPIEEPPQVSRKPQPTENCYFCKNRVYTVERYMAEGLLFHRGCFRCDYCGCPLRLSYYSFKPTGNGEGKFYCIQHHGLQSTSTGVSGQAVPNASKALPAAKPAVQPQKASGKEQSVKRTKERVEYVTESEVEESEYEQTKHNLCNVLRPSAFSDSDSSSSEEELHFSDEDASDEQPDLSWAELARKYNEQMQQAKIRRPPQKRTSSASSGSETETVEGASDADWEADSSTDKETAAEENGHVGGVKKQVNSRDEFSKHLLSLSPKQNIRQETKPSPTSVEIMRNRMAFFSTVCQPVRIDARAFLGLTPSQAEEARQTIQEQKEIAEAERLDEEKACANGKNDVGTEEPTKPKVRNEDRNFEKTSKRRVEKKPVVQKEKKRTKRRKKDEKSRVTADVGSTRLSTMHEAVPVVSISGATSSDDQNDGINLDGKTSRTVSSIPEKDQLTSLSKSCSGDAVTEKQGNGVLEEDELPVGHHSGEEGGRSSRSKSAGSSQASDNSQMLEYSDSEEGSNPPDEPRFKDALLEKQNQERVPVGDMDQLKADSNDSLIENQELTGLDEEHERSTKVKRESLKGLQERGDSFDSGEKEKGEGESDDERRLSHEYVVLEQGAADAEIEKYSPYEELITDGSDKEYTQIQFISKEAVGTIKSDDEGEETGTCTTTDATKGEFVEASAFDTTARAADAEIDAEKFDTRLQLQGEANILAWSDVAENLDDPQAGEAWPVRTEELSGGSDVQLSKSTVLELSRRLEQPLSVGVEENVVVWSESVTIIKDQNASETWPVKTEELFDESNVHQAACPVVQQTSVPPESSVCPETLLASLMNDKNDHVMADVNGSAIDDSKIRDQVTYNGDRLLDPLSRINMLLDSLSVNKTGLEDTVPPTSSSSVAASPADAGIQENGVFTTDEVKRGRPSSLIIAEDDGKSETAVSGIPAQQAKLAKSVKQKNLEQPSINEISSDSSSMCNASTTSGSADLPSFQSHEAQLEQTTSPNEESASDSRQGPSLSYDDGSSIDMLATGSPSEDVLSLDHVTHLNLGRKLKKEFDRITPVDVMSLPDSSSTGLKFDQRSVGQTSDSSTTSVLSPNRILDAKRKFFFEPPQPVRIDPRKVFTDIPSAKQPVLAKEVVGKASPVTSEEFDSVTKKPGVSVTRDTSFMSSGSETGVESSSVVESSRSETQSSMSRPPTEPEMKDALPVAPVVQSSQPVAPAKTVETVSKEDRHQKPEPVPTEKKKIQFADTELRGKKNIFKDKKRPNSAFVVMEENWGAAGKGSPGGPSRPVSAKPGASRPGQKQPGSPAIRAEAGLSSVFSQSDGASTEEASPSLVHKEHRLKGFYQQKGRSKESTPPAVKEVPDKKDKRKSLLALLIPSRSLDKKEKSTKSPVLQAKAQQQQPQQRTSKPTDAPSLAVVREKTKSLPLEKKQTPSASAQEFKKSSGEKSLKGKLKMKSGKTTTAAVESPDAGHSIYKEMAGIMEGIKKVEKRNRDKNSIRDRIEAVAPPPAKAPNTVLLPPKADVEDFETESELGDDRLSLRSFQSQMHLLSEEEAAKMKKRQQKAARKKQREKEVKRLHAAQEIQQQLEEVELRQREIERRGVEIEKALSGEGGSDRSRDENSLVQEWFDIVYERNVLVRYESELMVHARELELEDRQSRLEIQLRERIPHAESHKTELLKDEEQRILQELMEVVEQRDALVALLEEDRIRQQQYSKNLERIMVDRGFQLSPISYIHLPQSLAALQEDR